MRTTAVQVVVFTMSQYLPIFPALLATLLLLLLKDPFCDKENI